jgi:hypothetical protein
MRAPRAAVACTRVVGDGGERAAGSVHFLARVNAAGFGRLVAGRNALIAHGLLASALDHQLASEQRGEEPVLIGLTFKSHDGNYCRSFVLRATRTAGLACRVGSEWQSPRPIRRAAPSGDVQQASSMSPAILRVIEARMEGEALDADEEQGAKLSGLDLTTTGARALEQVEWVDVERPSQIARRLDRLHSRKPVAQHAMQRRAIGRFDEQLCVIARAPFGHRRGRRAQAP